MHTSFGRKHGYWVVGAIVALATATLTYVLVQQQRSANTALAQERFTEEVHASTGALMQHMAGYTEVVAGLRDLFFINPYLTYAEFSQVADTRKGHDNYPEIRNLSFSRRVVAAELPIFTERMRQQAVLTSRTMPALPVDPRPEYFLLEYLWPYNSKNHGVWGLDLATQPNNLAAMLASRDTGQTVVSAPFPLLQEDRPTLAFMLRTPVFLESQQPWATPGEREFLGAVAASVDVPAMLESVRSQGFLRNIAVRLEDVDTTAGYPHPVHLLGQTSDFATAQHLHHLPPQVRVEQVHNRRWRLEFFPARPLLSPIESAFPSWMAIGGGGLSLVLGVLTGWIWWRYNRALRSSEANFLAVFNQATVGMALANTRTGAFLRINRRYAEILGYSVQELQSLDFHVLLYPEDANTALALHAQLIAGQIREYHLEKRMLHKDGHPVWVDVTIAPMWAAGSAPTYHLGVMQDISERKRMQQALQASEQQLANILNHLPVGVAVIEADQRISYRNTLFDACTGFTAEQIPDLAHWWTQAYPDPHIRAQAQTHWQHLLAQAQASHGVIAPAEYTVTRADGQVRIMEISGVLLGQGWVVAMQDLTDRKAAEEKINYLEYFDALTQLPNRRQLLKILQRALIDSASHDTYGAVLMLDIDHFKTINDVKGHDCGDLLLQQVAERLRSSTHAHCSVARHGDDEFAILVEKLPPQPGQAVTQAEALGLRVLEVFRAPFLLRGEPYHTTASIGIALFHGMQTHAEELLKRADMAMYQAKVAGRDTLQFYSPNMQASIQERVELEGQMRFGLEHGHFELFYQPQIHGNTVMGCEALLRWRHPEKGMISPAVFIPLAEESGQILALGQWVLTTACQQLARWAHQPALAYLTIAINISPRQFHQPDFVQQVLHTIAETGADPRYLELELTEGLLLQDVEDTIDKMLQLKRHGIAFSLDDFGTGYSSLAYLKRLPLDQLKIDQGFVRDVLTDANDAAIARTVVALGTSLGLQVIAEGVETEAQRQFLELHGCNHWQGYLFSKPLPAGEFASWVARFDKPAPPPAR